MVWRLAVPAFIAILAITTPVAGGSPAPAASPSVPIAASPGPVGSAVPSVDPAQAARCLEHQTRPERCYLEGTARITLRGAIKDRVVWPLLHGAGATSDTIPSLALSFGPEEPARLVIDLPGVPGGSTTPADGGSASRGEAQLWWSLPDATAGYGHACAVTYGAAPDGRLTGRITCPKERTEDGDRYRIEVVFEALPLVPGPLPTPQPTATPEPTSVEDDPCVLVDAARAEAALGLGVGSVLLLGAGPGQCAGLVEDREVLFVAVGSSTSAADVITDGAFRGAACVPLPVADPTAAAASCDWPDGPAFVVAATMVDATPLVLSLATAGHPIDQVLDAVLGLLDAARARIAG